MEIRVVNVKQYNSTYKNVLMIDGEPVLIAKGKNTINECIAYLSNKNTELSDGKIKKILDTYAEKVLPK